MSHRRGGARPAAPQRLRPVRTFALLAVGLVFFASSPARAVPPVWEGTPIESLLRSAAPEVSFGTSSAESTLATDARAILELHCGACHTPDAPGIEGVVYDGGLDSILDFPRLRESTYVDLENPSNSEIYWVILDDEMPPANLVRAGHARHLTDAEKSTVLEWLNAGAPDLSNREISVPDPMLTDSQSHDFSAELLDRGRDAFLASCTSCHPASRALDKTKTLPRWRRTVARMAEKRGARVSDDDREPIAAYLTAHGLERTSDSRDAADVVAEVLDDLQFHATISTFWRGSARDETIENRGFVPEVWLGAVWHPEEGPFSARVTGCISCHTSNEPEGSRFEIAEAAFRFDVIEAFGPDDCSLDATVEAGRFIVPFGAFSAQSNPAAYRTVTRPLLYNMGQLVNRDDIGPAILPMPYSDEGVLVSVGSPLFDDVEAGFDAYVVNGLQANTDVDFFASRSYSDNNGDPSIGGRLTIGVPSVTLGASAMTGRMDDPDAGFGRRLNYQLYGVDVTATYGQRLRVVAEYARRTNDQITFLPENPRGEAEVEGYAVEADWLLLDDAGVSLITRYDSMLYDGDIPPPRSGLDGDYNVSRFTWGFDFALPGGSNLMLNHEHWSMPSGLDSVDVIGVRWVLSF